MGGKITHLVSPTPRGTHLEVATRTQLGRLVHAPASCTDTQTEGHRRSATPDMRRCVHAPWGHRTCRGCDTTLRSSATSCAPRYVSSMTRQPRRTPTTNSLVTITSSSQKKRITHHDSIRSANDDRIEVPRPVPGGRVAYSLGEEERTGEPDEEGEDEDESEVGDAGDGRRPARQHARLAC